MAVTGLTCYLTSALFFITICLITQLIGANQNQIHRRFEYKYSFKPPYLAQKDGSVPFWEYGGNAIASAENVRVTPSLKSQKGAIWTKQKTNFDWWEAEIVFRVSGRGRIGADGLAFWYTTEKGDYNGDVFGASDKWNGLGVFFDSFDNDNKHNNPYIMAVLNDGTKKFDHQNDGTTQLLSGCLRDFRNKPFPTRARVEYFKNTLTVLFHNGMTNNNEDYEMCLRAENVVLPKAGHFGISAATGGLADDHDVFQFLTSSLHTGDISEAGRITEEDSAKLSQEYLDYQRKLEEQKTQYRIDHPDANPPKDDMEDWFESDNQRELRQIWQAQTSMTEALKDLSRKMDEVIGRQERTLGLLSVSAQAGGTVGQIPAGAIQNFDSIRRQEVEALLTNQNTILTAVRDVRLLAEQVHSRADTIIQNQGRQPTAQIQTAGYDVQSVMNEVRDGINQIKLSVVAIGSKMPAQASAQVGGCPKINCLGLTPFLIAIVVHLLIILAYSMYKDNREAQHKKFY